MAGEVIIKNPKRQTIPTFVKKDGNFHQVGITPYGTLVVADEADLSPITQAQLKNGILIRLNSITGGQ